MRRVIKAISKAFDWVLAGIGFIFALAIVLGFVIGVVQVVYHLLMK